MYVQLSRTRMGGRGLLICRNGWLMYVYNVYIMYIYIYIQCNT